MGGVSFHLIGTNGFPVTAEKERSTSVGFPCYENLELLWQLPSRRTWGKTSTSGVSHDERICSRFCRIIETGPPRRWTFVAQTIEGKIYQDK